MNSVAGTIGSNTRRSCSSIFWKDRQTISTVKSRDNHKQKLMRNHFFTAGAVAFRGAGEAIWHVNQNDKLPIEQEYVLKPETHGMDCKSDDNLTACANEFGGRLDGLEYQKVMFVNNLDGQAIYSAGKFKRSQYEDAYDDFVSRYGKPDDRLERESTRLNSSH